MSTGLMVRNEEVPSSFVAVDPGGVHCGVAHFEVERGVYANTTTRTPEESVWTLRLVESYERRPDALYIEIRDWQADGIELAICEDFRLQKGRNQQGSKLETPKVIGVIEYLCRQAGLPCRLQDPSVRAYAEGWLRASGVDPRELGSNDHKRSAIVHGVYYVWKDKRVRGRVRFVADRDRRGAAIG